MDNTTSYSNGSAEYLDTAASFILYARPPQWAIRVEIVMLIIVFTIGVPGNTLIICVQAKTKNKTSTDYLVMIMAIYELLSSSFNALVKLAFDIDFVWIAVSSWFMCTMNHVGYHMAQYGAGQMLGVLAIDRVIKTMFPLNRWYTTSKTHIASGCVFVSTLALSLPHMFTQIWDPETLACGFSFHNMMVGKYVGIAASTVMMLVFIVMTFSYVAIALFLRRRHVKKLKSRKPKMPTPEAFVPSISTETSMSSEQTHVSVDADGSHGTTAGQAIATAIKTPEARQVKPRFITLEGRNINRLTFLMASISTIYIATNAVLWVLYATSPFLLGTGMLHLAYSIPMLNCISNPVVFFAMSSRFRRNARTLVCSTRK